MDGATASSTSSGRTSPSVPDYILRDIDKKLWKQFKERAAVEGRSLRWVIIEMIKHYVTHGLRASDGG